MIVVRTLQIAAVALFVLGWIACWVLQELLPPGNDLLGFIAYLCSPLPMIPGTLMLVALITEAVIDFRRR